jgi:hypothetical protein
MSEIAGLGSMLICVGMVVVIIGLASASWYLTKRAEEVRVKAILEHNREWGDDMCQWLIKGNYKLTDSHTAAIMNNFGALGTDSCQRLIQRTLEIGDSSDMVKLALGNPTSIDEQVMTEKDNKFRWIYGVPRRGATYIWFKNGKVTKIKT